MLEANQNEGSQFVYVDTLSAQISNVPCRVRCAPAIVLTCRGERPTMTRKLTQIAGELRKLEMKLADAGCTEHADEVGEALEKVEGVLMGLSTVKNAL